MQSEEIIRQHLINFLKGGLAHQTLDQAIANLPSKYRGAKTDNIPYSIWQLVEHLRIAQWDIVEFSRNPKYVSPEWPQGYWPQNQEPENDDIWDATVNAIRTDQNDMIEMVSNPASDLLKPFPYGNGQTLMREAMLIVDHNAYHIGQIILVRKLLGVW